MMLKPPAVASVEFRQIAENAATDDTAIKPETDLSGVGIRRSWLKSGPERKPAKRALHELFVLVAQTIDCENLYSAEMPTYDHLRWRITGRVAGTDYRVFQSEFIDAVNPRSGAAKRFSSLRCSNWVNVIALTSDMQVVVLRQYRPGTDSVCLEIPGGMIDDGEEPAVAAARELQEETGYVSKQWLRLGTCAPNPAIANNTLHTYLALGSELQQAPTPDDGEVLEVTTASLVTIKQWLADGTIDHALVLAAFAHFALHQPVLWAGA
jgi:ADP-ribose pyrophosphatase